MRHEGIGTLDDLAGLVKDAQQGYPIGIDTETTGLHPFAGDILRGISLASPRVLDGLYFPVTHPDEQNNLPAELVRQGIQAIVDSGCLLAWHHSVFDWVYLTRWGVTNVERFPFVDTKVFMWLWDENRSSGLKPLGVEFFGGDADEEQRAIGAWWDEQCRQQRERIKLAKQKVRAIERDMNRKRGPTGRATQRGTNPFDFAYTPETYDSLVAAANEARWKADDKWRRITAVVIAPYAAQDAHLTYRLAKHFGLMDEKRWLTGYRRELEMQQVVFRMIVRGVACDATMLLEANAKYRGRMTEIEQVFEGKIENLGSAKQKREYLYGVRKLPVLTLTDGGNASTSKDALDEFPDDEECNLLREYGRMEQGVKMYAEPMLSYLQRGDDGRLHTHFWTTKTVTGRLSSSDPNLMNLPKDSSLPEIKAAFHAEPGRRLFKYDLAQAELRVIASHTRDERLTSALIEGRKLHAETAVELFGTADEPFYTLAKNVNFGIPYEAGVATISNYAIKAGIPRKDAVATAERILDRHKRTFPRLHAVKDKLTFIARRDGKVPLHKPGRYRHFRSPGLWDPRYYTAMNAIVQGGIGEFVKDVMLEAEGFGEQSLDQYLLSLPHSDVPIVGNVKLVLQVHDELWFEGPDVEWLGEDILRWLNETSERINPFRLPMFWEAK